MKRSNPAGEHGQFNTVLIETGRDPLNGMTLPSVPACLTLSYIMKLIHSPSTLLLLLLLFFTTAAHADGDRIVVSGFEPFGGRDKNASWTVVQEMKKNFPSILERRIPVVWGAPMKAITEETSAPDVWIAFGEGTPTFQIEIVARNHRGSIPDNLSRLPSAPLIVPNGAAELKNKIDASALARQLTSSGFPTRESNNAGAYLCEEMLYSLLHTQSQQEEAFRLVLFVHVPVLGKPVQTESTAPQNAPVLKKVNAAYLGAFGKQLLASLQSLNQLHLPKGSTKSASN